MSKIISLDFWGTVAVFNPQYAAARKRYLAGLFKLPEDEAHARYQYVKRDCDHRAEKFGHAMTPLTAIKTMLEGTNAYLDAVEVLADFEQMVRDNPPLLHPRFPELLSQMRKEGFTVGVSSNTNFIAGSLIQEIFDLPWSFSVYSDEIGVSKPDPDFFRTAFKRAYAAASEPIPSFRSLHQMLHIGDNSKCDVEGAQRVDIAGILVKSPDETIAILDKIREYGGFDLRQHYAGSRLARAI